MSVPELPKAYDEIVTFFAQGPTREAIMNFSLSRLTLRRIRLLLQKKSAGTIDPTEVEELDQCIQLDRVLMLIRSRAMLESQGTIGA